MLYASCSLPGRGEGAALAATGLAIAPVVHIANLLPFSPPGRGGTGERDCDDPVPGRDDADFFSALLRSGSPGCGPGSRSRLSFARALSDLVPAPGSHERLRAAAPSTRLEAAAHRGSHAAFVEVVLLGVL